MKVSKYKIKKKIGVRGYYAEVEVGAEVLSEGNELNIKIECETDQYNTAILFGIEYFYELYQRKGNFRKLNVHILSFNHMPVDTTSIGVSFVVAKALCQALDIPSDDLILNEKTGHFNLPNP